MKEKVTINAEEATTLQELMGIITEPKKITPETLLEITQVIIKNNELLTRINEVFKDTSFSGDIALLQGKPASREELEAIIIPMIPDAIPGDDGDDGLAPTDKEMSELISKNLRKLKEVAYWSKFTTRDELLKELGVTKKDIDDVLTLKKDIVESKRELLTLSVEAKSKAETRIKETEKLFQDKEITLKKNLELFIGLVQKKADSHTHSNKATLDKFGEDAGKPTYDGNAVGENIYNANGTLTGDRTVDLNDKKLNFSGSEPFISILNTDTDKHRTYLGLGDISSGSFKGARWNHDVTSDRLILSYYGSGGGGTIMSFNQSSLSFNYSKDVKFSQAIIDKNNSKGTAGQILSSTGDGHIIYTDIPSGGEDNVQSDWNQEDDTQDDFIKNKPEIPEGSTDEKVKSASGDSAGYLDEKVDNSTVEISDSFKIKVKDDVFAEKNHNHNLNDLSEKSYNNLDDKPDLSNLHSHSNKDVIDKFGEDGNGNPTYNGETVDTTIAQRDVYDGLDSNDNTISLSAKQGKVLKDKQDLQQNEINTNTDKTNLNSDKISVLESGVRSDSEIKTAYENNADTNAFTDAEKTKLLNMSEGKPLPLLNIVSGNRTSSNGQSTTFVEKENYVFIKIGTTYWLRYRKQAGQLILENGSSGSSIYWLSSDEIKAGTSVNKNDNYIYFTNNNSNYVRRLDISTKTSVTMTINGGSIDTYATISSDGTYLYIINKGTTTMLKYSISGTDLNLESTITLPKNHENQATSATGFGDVIVNNILYYYSDSEEIVKTDLSGSQLDIIKTMDTTAWGKGYGYAGTLAHLNGYVMMIYTRHDSEDTSDYGIQILEDLN